MGFVSKINWPEMKSTAVNDNRRDNQTVLCYFKHVAFLEINITQIEASMTLFVFVILISKFLENDMFSIKKALRM